jgi:hypothetical protein
MAVVVVSKHLSTVGESAQNPCQLTPEATKPPTTETNGRISPALLPDGRKPPTCAILCRPLE